MIYQKILEVAEMAENTEMSTAVKATDGGRIVFANDVIATIAALSVV